ncbi:water channel AqpZ [Hyphomicrobium sp. 1Nfss2.1]|uniref:aquaporin n=1 Tax=Hyphomicrobium sp. 1Nfss2.1 TaxID=3413936 RepID=UPI003C7AA1A2
MRIKALAAEFIGTYMLVTSIVAAALFSFPIAGIVGVGVSVGFAVMAMIFAVGYISGGHFNPAVTLGLVAGGRFEASEAPGYIIAQCLGAIAATIVLFVIASGKVGGFEVGNFASNMYGGEAGYSMLSAFVVEVVLTGLFVLVIMGATSKRAPAGYAAIAIGFTLGAIHIMSIPIDNTSVNPARSLATALIAMGEPMAQLWLFWVAPILGGVIGGLFGRWLIDDQD